MRDILKPYSGTPSGTVVSLSIKGVFYDFFMRGRKKNLRNCYLQYESNLSAYHISNFLFDTVHTKSSHMFEKFRKKKEEYGESEGSGMVEERPVEEKENHLSEIVSESNIPPKPDNITQTQALSQSESQIGIRALKDKRVKLEEAIDYVGLMIKNLKDKRTNLEKEIEDESVDIKNLKEKLMKVSEYIEEENQGIQNLTRKRSAVENEADNVGSLINNLRGKLSGIDSVINVEGEKIKNFKESRKES
jgi:chromosome segregation ATPase